MENIECQNIDTEMQGQTVNNSTIPCVFSGDNLLQGANNKNMENLPALATIIVNAVDFTDENLSKSSKLEGRNDKNLQSPTNDRTNGENLQSSSNNDKANDENLQSSSNNDRINDENIQSPFNNENRTTDENLKSPSETDITNDITENGNDSLLSSDLNLRNFCSQLLTSDIEKDTIDIRDKHCLTLEELDEDYESISRTSGVADNIIVSEQSDTESPESISNEEHFTIGGIVENDARLLTEIDGKFSEVINNDNINLTQTRVNGFEDDGNKESVVDVNTVMNGEDCVTQPVQTVSIDHGNDPIINNENSDIGIALDRLTKNHLRDTEVMEDSTISGGLPISIDNLTVDNDTNIDKNALTLQSSQDSEEEIDINGKKDSPSIEDRLELIQDHCKDSEVSNFSESTLSIASGLEHSDLTSASVGDELSILSDSTHIVTSDLENSDLTFTTIGEDFDINASLVESMFNTMSSSGSGSSSSCSEDYADLGEELSLTLNNSDLLSLTQALTEGLNSTHYSDAVDFEELFNNSVSEILKKGKEIEKSLFLESDCSTMLTASEGSLSPYSPSLTVNSQLSEATFRDLSIEGGLELDGDHVEDNRDINVTRDTLRREGSGDSSQEGYQCSEDRDSFGNRGDADGCSLSNSDDANKGNEPDAIDSDSHVANEVLQVETEFFSKPSPAEVPTIKTDCTCKRVDLQMTENAETVLHEAWNELRSSLRQLHRAIIPSSTPKTNINNPKNRPSITRIKVLSNLLLSRDPYQLFTRMLQLSQELCIELKVRLLATIHDSPQLDEAKKFVHGMCDSYELLMNVCDQTHGAFEKLDSDFLAQFGLNWVTVNIHTFYSTIYTDPDVHDYLAFCVSKVHQCVSENETLGCLESLKRTLSIAESVWLRAELLIHEFVLQSRAQRRRQENREWSAGGGKPPIEVADKQVLNTRDGCECHYCNKDVTRTLQQSSSINTNPLAHPHPPVVSNVAYASPSLSQQQLSLYPHIHGMVSSPKAPSTVECGTLATKPSLEDIGPLPADGSKLPIFSNPYLGSELLTEQLIREWDLAYGDTLTPPGLKSVQGSSLDSGDDLSHLTTSLDNLAITPQKIMEKIVSTNASTPPTNIVNIDVDKSICTSLSSVSLSDTRPTSTSAATCVVSSSSSSSQYQPPLPPRSVFKEGTAQCKRPLPGRPQQRRPSYSDTASSGDEWSSEDETDVNEANGDSQCDCCYCHDGQKHMDGGRQKYSDRRDRLLRILNHKKLLSSNACNKSTLPLTQKEKPTPSNLNKAPTNTVKPVFVPPPSATNNTSAKPQQSRPPVPNATSGRPTCDIKAIPKTGQVNPVEQSSCLKAKECVKQTVKTASLTQENKPKTEKTMGNQSLDDIMNFIDGKKPGTSLSQKKAAKRARQKERKLAMERKLTLEQSQKTSDAQKLETGEKIEVEEEYEDDYDEELEMLEMNESEMEDEEGEYSDDNLDEEEEEEDGPLAELRRRAPDITITVVKGGQKNKNLKQSSDNNKPVTTNPGITTHPLVSAPPGANPDPPKTPWNIPSSNHPMAGSGYGCGPNSMMGGYPGMSSMSSGAKIQPPLARPSPQGSENGLSNLLDDLNKKSNNKGSQMVTIRRVMDPISSEPTVTITLKGEEPKKDKVLFKLVNGQVPEGKEAAPKVKQVKPVYNIPEGTSPAVAKRMRKQQKKERQRDRKQQEEDERHEKENAKQLQIEKQRELLRQQEEHIKQQQLALQKQQEDLEKQQMNMQQSQNANSNNKQNKNNKKGGKKGAKGGNVQGNNVNGKGTKVIEVDKNGLKKNKQKFSATVNEPDDVAQNFSLPPGVSINKVAGQPGMVTISNNMGGHYPQPYIPNPNPHAGVSAHQFPMGKSTLPAGGCNPQSMYPGSMSGLGGNPKVYDNKRGPPWTSPCGVNNNPEENVIVVDANMKSRRGTYPSPQDSLEKKSKSNKKGKREITSEEKVEAAIKGEIKIEELNQTQLRKAKKGIKLMEEEKERVKKETAVQREKERKENLIKIKNEKAKAKNQLKNDIQKGVSKQERKVSLEKEIDDDIKTSKKRQKMQEERNRKQKLEANNPNSKCSKHFKDQERSILAMLAKSKANEAAHLENKKEQSGKASKKVEPVGTIQSKAIPNVQNRPNPLPVSQQTRPVSKPAKTTLINTEPPKRQQQPIPTNENIKKIVTNQQSSTKITSQTTKIAPNQTQKAPSRREPELLKQANVVKRQPSNPNPSIRSSLANNNTVNSLSPTIQSHTGTRPLPKVPIHTGPPVPPKTGSSLHPSMKPLGYVPNDTNHNVRYAQYIAANATTLAKAENEGIIPKVDARSIAKKVKNNGEVEKASKTKEVKGKCGGENLDEETEREVEAFKRFCLYNVPRNLGEKPKVNFNMKDILIKKKDEN